MDNITKALIQYDFIIKDNKQVEKAIDNINRKLQSYSKISDAVAASEKKFATTQPKVIDANQMFGDSIKKVTANLNSQLKSVGSLPKDFAKNFTDINAEIIQAGGGMPKVANGVTFMNNAIKGANASLTKMGNTLKHNSKFLNPDVFQGWAMSLMFAGMALRRTYDQIYKFGTKAFQEVSHSVEGTVTQTDMLEGSMKYLGFTIGQALEPVIAFLIPIVDGFAQWAETHPVLVQIGTVLLGIVGTLAMLGGMWTLAWTNGLLPMLTGLGVLQTVVSDTGIKTTEFTTGFKNGLNSAKTAFNTLKGAIGLGLLVAVGFRIFGKGDNEPITTSEFINNLGLATLGGFMAGGPFGALAAFLVTLTVMLSHESVRQMLKETEEAMKQQQAVFKRGLTASEAFKIFQDEITVIPDTWAKTISDEMNSFIGNITGAKIGNILDQYSMNPYNFIGSSRYLPGQSGYLYRRDYTQDPLIADYSQVPGIRVGANGQPTIIMYDTSIVWNGDGNDLMNQIYRYSGSN